jgi:hypothetical protein
LLAGIRISSIAIGVAAATLVAAVVSLLAGALIGADQSLSVLIGLLFAFFAAGYGAGRTALHSFGFHGAVSGIAFSAVVMLVARLSGAPSNPTEVLILAIVGMTLGSLGGNTGRRAAVRRAANRG